MVKAARGQQTRNDILQTAARLFALRGYFHTSTNDILEAVSVNIRFYQQMLVNASAVNTAEVGRCPLPLVHLQHPPPVIVDVELRRT